MGNYNFYVFVRRNYEDVPVGWNIHEILKWQIETLQKVEKKCQEDFRISETYEEMGA